MIKYHDNINGQQYGADHKLTDNWNPEGPFSGERFARVFFRIYCPTYDRHMSFDSAEERTAFYEEMRQVLDSFSVPEGTGWLRGLPDNVPGMEHLHIHPQEISGVVEKEKIKPIAEALNACQTVSIRWVDVYEDISPMTNEEFREKLRGQSSEIMGDLLQAFRTRRSNLYATPENVVTRLSAKYSVRRRECESGRDFVCEQELHGMIEELLRGGYLAQAHTKAGIGYRAVRFELEAQTLLSDFVSDHEPQEPEEDELEI